MDDAARPRRPRPPTALLVLLFVAAAALPGAAGNCHLEDQNDRPIVEERRGVIALFIRDYYDRLRDNVSVGYHYYTCNAINVVDYKAFDDDGFLDVELDVEKEALTIVTGKNFNKYEEEKITAHQEFRFTISCSDGTEKSVTALILLLDTNNHAPSLPDNEIVFELPMPFPPNIFLTHCFGDSIIGREIDVYSLDMMASVVGAENLIIAEATPINSITKSFEVSLKSANTMFLKEDLQFDLVITDPGTYDDPANPRTITKSITIKVYHPEQKDETPFEEPLHIPTIMDPEVKEEEQLGGKGGGNHDES